MEQSTAVWVPREQLGTGCLSQVHHDVWVWWRVEPATFWSQVGCPTATPSWPCLISRSYEDLEQKQNTNKTDFQLLCRASIRHRPVQVVFHHTGTAGERKKIHLSNIFPCVRLRGTFPKYFAG